MANYVVSDASLGAVANAIRTKGGTSAGLTFPAGFVSAVDAIPTGGGSFKYDYGSFTLETDWTPAGADSLYTIGHDLGEAPKVVIICPDTESETPGTQGYMWFDRMVDRDQRVSTAATTEGSVYVRLYMDADGAAINVSNGGAGTYNISNSADRVPTSSSFFLFRTANNVVWGAGDYKYFVSEGWWLLP